MLMSDFMMRHDSYAGMSEMVRVYLFIWSRKLSWYITNHPGHRSLRSILGRQIECHVLSGYVYSNDKHFCHCCTVDWEKKRLTDCKCFLVKYCLLMCCCFVLAVLYYQVMFFIVIFQWSAAGFIASRCIWCWLSNYAWTRGSFAPAWGI